MFKIIGADGRQYGPASVEQVRQWMAEGRVNGQTVAWREGGANWLPLGAFPEFASPAAPPLGAAVTLPIGSTGEKRTNSMALAGFVFAIVSIFFGWCCCFGIPFNLLGLIFSAVALYQINADPSQQGKSLAIAGIVISLLSMFLGFLIGIFSQALTIGSHHGGFHI